MRASETVFWDFDIRSLPKGNRFLEKILLVLILSDVLKQVSGLGSMSTIAISYGENGPAFCGLKSDGSLLVSCYGANSAIMYGYPAHFQFVGLTGGDGFVCGLLMESNQPYCWGSSSYIQMGVPQPMIKGSEYLEISAGDYHLCGLRKQPKGRFRDTSFVDCWGYNMTQSYEFHGQIQSITAGSEFNCGLFSQNKTVFCWGDETSSHVISLIPPGTRFQRIAAGGYHVCGILEGVDSRVRCWGKSINIEEATSAGYSHETRGSVNIAPSDPMLSIAGGKFHACGIRSYDRGVICWGFIVTGSLSPQRGTRLYEIAAGDYFTCGVLADRSFLSTCWGVGFPTYSPVAVSPGLCKPYPCAPQFYEFQPGNVSCKENYRICMPCTSACSTDMYEVSECKLTSDRKCAFNCSSCLSTDCFSYCSSNPPRVTNPVTRKNSKFWSLQLPIIIAEVAFAVLLILIVSLTSILYIRYKLRNCRCSANQLQSKKSRGGSAAATAAYLKVNHKTHSDLDEHKIRRARMFTYKELERATDGFKEESQVGRGSFSCVFKGVLKDGTVVAVKRAIFSPDMKKHSKEFHTELDLLSRLNHAHLLNLLGYCEEGEERLLVYEFMAHGSLHQHLHNENKASREQLDWVRRVTIAVQAARGIEYLHGYACPPVIHRDIKSSNILIDEEHNARVSDFGLSLLGPVDSSSPLAELPAGTLGYLDPEYYRLHYLTTKSDVYSFGVLLLEILSGRKAIDMQFEEGNIVEWAVPSIKSGDITSILDPVLKPPSDIEALKRIANVACKCVRMRGKERPSMDKVTTSLERALAQLMGSPCSEQPILPTEVILGSSRMHKKTSQRSSNRSASEINAPDTEDPGFEFRAPSWITFPSVASSERMKSSVSDADVMDGKNIELRSLVHEKSESDALKSLEEEIGPASPQHNLYLQHNF
ncbi:unnamed protein product [Rhodiola kirilowii]